MRCRDPLNQELLVSPGGIETLGPEGAGATSQTCTRPQVFREMVTCPGQRPCAAQDAQRAMHVPCTGSHRAYYMDTAEARTLGDPPRYTHRLVVLEEGQVVDRLASMASESGHSLSAEVRSAIRFWIKAWDAADE